MVSNSFTSPSFSRVPGLVDRLEELRDRPETLRQIALLVVVAAAGALLLILPEPTEDPVTIAALSDDEADDEADTESAEDADNDWLSRDERSAETSEDELSGVDRAAMVAGFAAAANGADLDTTTSSQQTTTSSSSTTAAPTTAAPTTEAPTTAAPTTAAPAETTGDDADNAESSQSTDDNGETSDSDTADTDTDEPVAAADAADGEPAEEAVDPAAEVADGDEPAEAEQAAPATTTTTAAPAADNGFVDAGHGVMVPPILLKIRYCESTDNYTAANPASSARGAYQFLTGSWRGYGHADRYGVTQAHLAAPAQQDEAALITWQADGTRPWLASKHCWG